MAQPNSFLAAIMVVAGILMIALSIPLILEKVKMNHWYGVRLPISFTSDGNWYTMNKHGGRKLSIAGAVLIIIGIILFFIPLGNEVTTIFVALLPALVLIPVVISIFQFANKLK